MKRFLKLISIYQMLAFVLCLFKVSTLPAQALIFTHLDAFDGLSSNRIHSILQLTDGRMAFITPDAVNLYDGGRFRYWPITPADTCRLTAYGGACHVYAGTDSLLWIKQKHSLCCLDVMRGRYMQDPEHLIHKLGVEEDVSDIFLDSEKTIWVVTSKGVWNAKRKQYFLMPKGKAVLQDVEVLDSCAYLFFDDGAVACYSQRDARLLYTQAAYQASERALFGRTSLVVHGKDGNFYQLRCGQKAACFAFNPRTREWKKLLQSETVLHTLIVPTNSTAYITCGKGLWKINLQSGKTEYHPSLEMSDGGSVVAAINTVYIDQEGGWWMGTYNKGLLYAHPWRNLLTDGRQNNVNLPLRTFKPILTGMQVNGKSLLLERDSTVSMQMPDFPYIRRLDLDPDENSLSLTFSALNYAMPVHTCYKYRLLTRKDSIWHTATFNSQNHTVDERGLLHLSFSNLAPGFYCVQVMAATHEQMPDAPVTELAFLIHTPWWLTVPAYIGYAMAILLLLSLAAWLCYHWNQRKKKELILLERVRDLIARCNEYEKERTESSVPLETEPEQDTPTLSLSKADNDFLQRALTLVKAHLDAPYSVEDLSRDLCMERSGLYKKLNALLKQSPSLFIRNIRLEQAACLLAENRYSIAEIAYRTGFSSSSYLSKCFQEAYGCKPSEYAEKQQKST